MATDLATVITNARCVDSCIPPGMRNAVLIYLLAVAAGLDPTDTNTLMNNAKCIDSCIPDGMKPAVIAKLLCDMAGAITGCGGVDGEGDPTGVVTPEFTDQLYHDTTNDVYYRSTGNTSADWTAISGGAPAVPCENLEGVGDPT